MTPMFPDFQRPPDCPDPSSNSLLAAILMCAVMIGLLALFAGAQ